MQAQKNTFNRILIFMGIGLFIFMVAITWFGLVLVKSYRETISSNQKEQMLMTVKSVCDSLHSLVDEYSADLKAMSKFVDDNNENAEKIWCNYLEAHSPVLCGVAVRNKDFMISEGVGKEKISEYYSCTKINDDLNLYLASCESGRYVFILKYERKNRLTSSIMIDVATLYESSIAKFRFGKEGYIVVKDSKGILLLHPEPKQWGIQVIDGRNKMYPGKDMNSLMKLIKSQLEGKTGIEEYTSYWWVQNGAPVSRKISAYAPVRFSEDFLIVSAVIKADEVDNIISEGFLNMFLLFVFFTCTVLGMIGYMVYLYLQNRKSNEQVKYLAKMNEVLEQMHQSEENIAHQQRLQIMGTMTGGIAHEFNNLLTPIMGYAELLMMSSSEDSDEYDNAHEIYDASSKAKDIIQQLSGMSRRNMETTYKILNVKEFLEKSLKMVRTVCPENVHLDVKYNIDEENILGNRTQLNQVILNVCVNAIHAIGRNPGNIFIAASVEYNNHDRYNNMKPYVRIDIADDGCGMSEAVLKQIFEPFFTTKQTGHGTGLGLSLTEQLVTSHRGFINAESEEGKGSVFHIYFPVVSEDKEKNLDMMQHEQSGMKMSFVVIDDNNKVLKQLEKSFKKIPSIDLFMFSDFESAFECISEKYFDVIIAEQSIDGKSAVEFYTSLKPSIKTKKLIMADVINRELAEAKQAKIVDDYIMKPVSIIDIINKLKDLQRGNVQP